MTCYMRQMSWLIEAIGMHDTPAERRRLDRAIRDALLIPEEDRCPEVWAAIKSLDNDGRAQLIESTGAMLASGPDGASS